MSTEAIIGVTSAVILVCLFLAITTVILVTVFGIGIIRRACRLGNPDEDITAEILLLIFAPYVGFYLAEKKFTENCRRLNIKHSDKSILYLFLGFLNLSYVNLILLSSDVKDAERKYTVRQMADAQYKEADYVNV